jgi:outer membrane protein TolC
MNYDERSLFQRKNKGKRLCIAACFLLAACYLLKGQETDSLYHYLKTGGQNNPAVKAAFLRYEAALQKPAQMGAYEDPQLEMGFFLEPMEIAGGREIARFQVMQMFPWFGTKKAARTEAQHMAKMAFEEFRETRDKLYLEIHTQWNILCTLRQKQANSEANRNLLQHLEKLALQKFSSGQPGNGKKSTETREQKMESRETAARSMPGMNMDGNASSGNAAGGDMENMNMSGSVASGMLEVLRIQLEIMEIESAIEGISSELKAGKARFNALLNRPAGSEVALPDTLTQMAYLPDMETALFHTGEQNPMLGMISEEAQAYRAKSEMDKKMAYPMFGIGLQYMWIGKTPENGGSMNDMSGMNDMNGKDMLMPMLSVSIPVFRNKYKAARQESKRLQQASEAEYADTRNLLEAALYQFRHQLDEAQRKITLYRKQSELAQRAYDLVVREFVSGKSDLSAVLQIQRQLLDYQFKEAEAVSACNTAVANMRKITAQESVSNDFIPNL